MRVGRGRTVPEPVVVAVVVTALAYLIGGVLGVAVGGVAVLVGLVRPRIAVVMTLVLVASTALATALEQPLTGRVVDVARFAVDRPFATHLGRFAGVLLLVSVAVAARAERRPVAVPAPPPLGRRRPVSFGPLAAGCLAAAGVLEVTGDHALRWLSVPLLAIPAVLFLAWSARRIRARAT